MPYREAVSLARWLNQAVVESTTFDHLRSGIAGVEFREILLRCRVVRPADLFTAEFTLRNLRVDAANGTSLVRRDQARRAQVVMELQGQHFGEQVLQAKAQAAPGEPEAPEAPPEPPNVLKARLAHPSRIAVTMPANLQSLDYTLEALLDAITTWPLSLDPLAHHLKPPAAPGAAANRAGLMATVSLLQGLADELEAALGAGAAGAVARALTQRAARTATRAIDAVRRNDRPQEARESAGSLLHELERDRMGDDETRELALALHDVRVAQEVAEYVLAHPLEGIDLTKMADAAGGIRLLLEPHPPSQFCTALELPYRLIQSPHAETTFVHPDAALTLSGRTELWRTTLARRSDAGPKKLDASGAPVTVMWSPDCADPIPAGPFHMSLKPYHRDALVRLMSGHLQKLPFGTYRPAPATVRRLQLSAWGGVLELNGVWDERPEGINVEAWDHDASYGRDERVRVVEAGYLYPFGHRASLITLTERLFETHEPSGFAAPLRQRQFIVVREFDRVFPAHGQQHAGRKLPFTRITCLTRQTPDLLKLLGIDGMGDTPAQPKDTDPNRPDEDSWPTSPAFWPIVFGTTPAPFEFEALDLAGHCVTFTSPVIFLFRSLAEAGAEVLPGLMNQLDVAWSGTENAPNARAKVGVGGQMIRMAPPAQDGDAGDVDIPVAEIVFEATQAVRFLPPFHPAIREATVHIRALDAVTDTNAVHTVAYESDAYLEHGYEGNPWHVFLQLTCPHEVSIGKGGVNTDRVGGIGQPSQTLTAITAGSGAVSGTVASLIAGRVAAADMFPEAKILGGFDLKDLIRDIDAGNTSTLPGYRTEQHHDRSVIIWEYCPAELTLAPDAAEGLVINAGRPSELTLSTKSTTFSSGNREPKAEAKGRLTNFKLDYGGFITVWFDEFSFTSHLGQKPDSRPVLNAQYPVVFGGPLEFVNTLSEIIPAGGFTGRPIIRTSPIDLTVGYDFELPNIEMGIFALKNVIIGALLRIPFTGEPVALRFYFSKRESPFLLKVSMFGGGGFFDIVTTAKGVQAIEAAFEFGAYAELNAGVASGGVYMKAGVYFHWRTGAVELEGYLEMGGELSVLGIVSVSITLHLALGYFKDAQKGALVRGQAKLVIEVSLLFFSVSVKALIERQFKGSPGDPKFGELVPDDITWTRYCHAFA